MATLAVPQCAVNSQSENNVTQVLLMYFILTYNVVFCRLKYALIPHVFVFFAHLRCQQNERAPLLLSIQSKTGKAVNCMAPLPLVL